MRTIFITLLNILMLASCTKQGAMLSNDEPRCVDSLKFCIALMPVMDCLPFYYAKQSGMFDTLEFNVSLLPYPSMMDADTALLYGHAQMSYTAMPRIQEMNRHNNLQFSPVIQCMGSYYLMLNPKSKIKKVEQLNEKLVALSRNNTADWWSDSMLLRANMPLDTIFRPQFNDVALRTSMLTRSLVDAALLPQPYATTARMAGCRQLSATPDTMPGLNVFATPLWTSSDTLRLQQLKQITQVYNIVIEKLNKEADKTLLYKILLEDMKQPKEYIDSIVVPYYHKATAPNQAQRDKAAAWLKSRTLKP